MKKKLLCLCSAFILSFMMLTNVSTLGLVKADETVVQKGHYDSLRLVAGNNVTNKAEIDGLSLIAGNEVNAYGSAPYGFIAGNNVTINEKIEKDLFVAGNNVRIGNEAELGRDVYVAANNIKISSNVARDVRLGASTVDISGIVIGGDAYIAAEQIIVDGDTVIEGKLSYPEETNIDGLDKAHIGSIETYKAESVDVEIEPRSIIYAYIISVISGYIVILLILLLLPKVKEKLEKIELEAGNVVKTSAIGLAILIGVPFASIIALFTGFLTPLALIVLAIYVIAIYLSSLFVSYIIGNLITTKLFKNDNMYLALLVGIVVVKVIGLIPVIGWLISAIIFFYGLGLMLELVKTKE